MKQLLTASLIAGWIGLGGHALFQNLTVTAPHQTEVPASGEENAKEVTHDAFTDSTAHIMHLMSNHTITREEGGEILNIIESKDPEQIQQKIESLTDSLDHEAWHESHGNKTIIILLSILATARFASMIIGSARGKPISFIKHHAVFAWLTAIMATQMPHEIMHGLIESAVAFAAIFGITRLSRGITNKVDFEKLDAEEAKTALWLLGPIASLITTPAAASVFAKMRKKMSEDDKHIAMHAVGNIDGGVLRGDFPFLYNRMKNGIVQWAIWQAWVMAPIMLFHKLYQWWLWKIGPKKIAKSLPQIRQIVKWFRFDRKRLGHSASLEGEEIAQAHEFLAYLKEKIKSDSTIDAWDREEIIDSTGEIEEELWLNNDDTDNRTNEDTESTAWAENRQNLENFATSLEDLLTNPETSKDIAVIVAEVRRALADWHISREELEQFMHGDHPSEDHIITKIPWFKWIIARMEARVDGIFNKIMKKIHANHNEVEVSRVFTVQALAISLLIPVFTVLLKEAPWALEWLDAGFSSAADNYAATAVTWIADNAKSIIFAILGWTLSIFGNMSNLNFLGKDGDFKTSLRMAKRMAPTLMFAYFRCNSDAALSYIRSNMQTQEPKEIMVSDEQDEVWDDKVISNMSEKERRKLSNGWVLYTRRWKEEEEKKLTQ